MEKWLSRSVIVDGSPPRMAIVEIDSRGKVANVRPFDVEEHSTAFTDSCIIVDTESSAVRFVEYVAGESGISQTSDMSKCYFD